MTDDGTLLTTLGRLGGGIYQAVKGGLWRGNLPAVVTRPDMVTITVSDPRATITSQGRRGSITISSPRGCLEVSIQ